MLKISDKESAIKKSFKFRFQLGLLKMSFGVFRDGSTLNGFVIEIQKRKTASMNVTTHFFEVQRIKNQVRLLHYHRKQLLRINNG